MKVEKNLQIKKELFYRVDFICDSEEIEFFTSSDTSYSIWDDGDFGTKENGYKNLITKNQFDEIIRVRSIILKEK